RLRMARPHRVPRSGRGGGAHRPREPRRPSLGARPDGACRMSIAARTTAVGLGGEGSAGAPSVPHELSELAQKRVIVGYGFWIFLLSDIVMFSAFFAAYSVLVKETAGGPSGKDLFHLHIVAFETAFLLLSSFACGVASIGARAHRDAMYYGAMAVTALFGAGFLFLEIREFVGMIAVGAGPQRSAFLSAF